MRRVLVVGGTGRIGRSIAADLIEHTDATITISGRHSQQGHRVAAALGPRVKFQPLDVAADSGLEAAIAPFDVVIHCAGPFHGRDARVLEACIHQGVNYLDVSDHRSFSHKALAYRDAAIAAGTTAVINTGIFPGISNSMVRQDVERLDQPEAIHLSYVVAGSGGAGPTVMRTTFLGLQHPFEVWRQGQWQLVQPYSDRETIPFPAPYGPVNVFWFDVPEAWTLPQAFPIETVVTKFGSVPEIYNGITWALAHWLPRPWLQQQWLIEFLAQSSYFCTQVSDRFSGQGVAIRSEVTGQTAGQATTVCSTLVLPDTAVAAGYGTGSIAQLILAGELTQPGVWTVEECLPTTLFQQTLQARGVEVKQSIEQS